MLIMYIFILFWVMAYFDLIYIICNIIISLFQVLAVSPTHWVSLYNSDDHGLSINR